MEPLKEMFNKGYYEQLANAIHQCDKSFDKVKFIKDVTKNITPLSLNERMRNTSIQLHQHLPGNYSLKIAILKDVAQLMPRGYTALVYPDYISQYGIPTFDYSVKALAYFTQFGSSEFAIRAFLRHDFKKAIQYMYDWANNSNHHIRRLASEGSRPRLPWGGNLHAVIENPALTMPILNTLKQDKELYVKKSVANHLNDITKDNAAYMLSSIAKWDLTHTDTAWIVKHACRTLIKKGDKGALALFAYEKDIKIKLENFTLHPMQLSLGDTLTFSFDIISTKSTAQKIVIDYCVYYRKSSGELSPKVFKLKEVELQPKTTLHIIKKQTFKDFTTRKHYLGLHKIGILVNGKAYPTLDFMLV